MTASNLPNPCLLSIILTVETHNGPQFVFHYPPNPSAHNYEAAAQVKVRLDDDFSIGSGDEDEEEKEERNEISSANGFNGNIYDNEYDTYEEAMGFVGEKDWQQLEDLTISRYPSRDSSDKLDDRDPASGFISRRRSTATKTSPFTSRKKVVNSTSNGGHKDKRFRNIVADYSEGDLFHGTDALAVLGLDDTVLDASVYSDRDNHISNPSSCQSHPADKIKTSTDGSTDLIGLGDSYLSEKTFSNEGQIDNSASSINTTKNLTSGSYIHTSTAWDHVLGFETDFLGEILCPPRNMCNSRFELTVDDMVFLGLPRHSYPNGSWKRQPKKTAASVGGGSSSKTNQVSASRGLTNSRRSSYNTGRASSLYMSNSHTDSPNKTDEKEINNEHYSDSRNDSCNAPTAEAETDASSIKKNKPAKSDVTEDCSMRMFHVVFAMNPPVFEYNERVDQMYSEVIKLFTKELKRQQSKSCYVWNEIKKIALIRENAALEGWTIRDLYTETLSSSTLALAIAQLYIAISRSEIANVFINDQLRSFQLPINTHFSSLPGFTEGYIGGSSLTTVNDPFVNTNAYYQPSHYDQNSNGDTVKGNNDVSNNVEKSSNTEGGTETSDNKGEYNVTYDKDRERNEKESEEKEAKIDFRKDNKNNTDINNNTVDSKGKNSGDGKTFSDKKIDVNEISNNYHSSFDLPGEHFTLLLLDEPENVIRFFDNDETMTIFIRELNPVLPFRKLIGRHGFSYEQIDNLSRHLVYWRKARAILPIHYSNIYIVSPLAPMTYLNDFMIQFKEKFRDFPPLSKMLSALSTGKPRRLSEGLIPSKNHNESYYQVIAWMLRYGFITQLRTFLWIKITKRIKTAVLRDEEIAREIKEDKLNELNKNNSKRQSDVSSTDNSSKNKSANGVHINESSQVRTQNGNENSSAINTSGFLAKPGNNHNFGNNFISSSQASPHVTSHLSRRLSNSIDRRLSFESTNLAIKNRIPGGVGVGTNVVLGGINSTKTKLGQSLNEHYSVFSEKDGTSIGTYRPSQIPESNISGYSGNSHSTKLNQTGDNHSNGMDSNGNEINASTYLRKLNEMSCGSNNNNNSGGNSVGKSAFIINPEDLLEDSIILEPLSASREERKWIAKMLENKSPEIKKTFNKVMRYLNGKHSLEKVIVKEQVSKHRIRELLHAIDENIIFVRHW